MNDVHVSTHCHCGAGKDTLYKIYKHVGRQSLIFEILDSALQITRLNCQHYSKSCSIREERVASGERGPEAVPREAGLEGETEKKEREGKKGEEWRGTHEKLFKIIQNKRYNNPSSKLCSFHDPSFYRPSRTWIQIMIRRCTRSCEIM